MAAPTAEQAATLQREEAERRRWEETVRKAEAKRLAAQQEPADSSRKTDPGMPPKKSPFPKADK
jgi:hypothetical protein